nr:DEAD/DEAH box helicase [Motilibacter deserti]
MRDVQREVFNAWYERRKQRDVVIKMNTGNGKTVVGLLLLKSALNEGAGPAAYFTPDNYLADQVEQTARELGLRTSRDPRDPMVAAGTAILVTNLKTLFNGRSKFGVASEGRKIKLGTALIDDAHACLSVTEEQFQLRIPSNHDAYKALLSLFEAPLQDQSPAQFLSLKDGDRTAAMLVPAWSWFDEQKRVIATLHPHRQDAEFEWTWPLLLNALPFSRCVFTPEAVEIKPYFPPVQEVPSFDQAARRIYLTATLADDSVLVTHFAASATSVREPITPSAADDIGDRMIIVPQSVQPSWTDDQIKGYLAELAQRRNVIVIVPSNSRAKYWGDVAAATLTASNLQAGVTRLKAGHVGLVVLVGKYDGVDLPDDACRVLVIDGLPEYYSGVERVEASALSDTMAMTGRHLQRIEQGMGRGVRSRDDYCVVLLLGAKLVWRLHDAPAAELFGPATRAQMALSKEVASQLSSGDLDDLKAAVEQCLQRVRGWTTASRNALVGVKYGPGAVQPAAEHSRRAFELALQSRYGEAQGAQQMAVNALAEPRERGWLKQMLSAYLHPEDAVRAQKNQMSALDDNRALLKPEQGIAYVKLKGAAGQQAVAASEFLSATYESGQELLIGVNAMLADLDFDDDPLRVDSFEEAVANLGRHLGFVTQRPEKDFKRGPDGLWALGGLNYLVIECKSGAVTDFIRKKDLDQLSGAVSWFHTEYEDPAACTPVMFHRVSKLHQEASAAPGTRVVTEAQLTKLRTAVLQVATALAVDDAFRNPDLVGEQLRLRKLQGRGVVEAYASSTLMP